jgi:polyphenol oxidase
MIVPPGPPGAAFTVAAEGDQRSDFAARQAVALELGISPDWATVKQVHGGRVTEVSGPGRLAEADALFTAVPSLPLAVFTADCLGVVIHADTAVGVAHAGWRGLGARAIGNLLEAMRNAGHHPQRAAIGPAIGPCCFEVGEEVLTRFGGYQAVTTWQTPSVDLVAAAADQLAGVAIWSAGSCTRHDPAFFSHRRDQTPPRMAAIGWVP